MSLGHEKLIVYQHSIEYVTWVTKQLRDLKGNNRNLKDQWLRASHSIPLNIAEGNGKSTMPDRRRFFEIARGSAMECAAIQDIMESIGLLDPDLNHKWKTLLDKIALMLSRLGGRGY